MNAFERLIDRALKDKRGQIAYYRMIIDTTSDDKIFKQINQICIDEDNQYKSLQLMHNKSDGSRIDNELPKVRTYRDLKQALENCINSELNSVELLRDARNAAPTQAVRDKLYEIITDEQKHTEVMLSAYASLNNMHRQLAPGQNPVTTKEKHLRFKGTNIEEDLRIPIFQSPSYPSIIKNINSNVENDVLEFKRQMEESASEGAETARRKGIRFIPYRVSTIYSTTYNKHNILSFSMIYNEFVGGKNAFIRAPYNYDLTTGRSLGLKDLFKPGINYRDLINREVRKRLIANKNQYFPGTLENFKGIAEDQPFYLEDGNIVIFFGFNEIAPTAAGLPVIRIPFTAFRNDIKPMYLS